MLSFLFFAVLTLSFLLVLFYLRPKASEKAMEKRITLFTVTKAREFDAEALPVAVPEPTAFLERISFSIQNTEFAKDIQLLILHSGSKTTLTSVLGSSVFIAIGAAMLAHLTIDLMPVDVVAFGVGLGSRWGLLKFKKARRIDAFNQALPDAIELIARALRAGHAMGSSIEIVSEQSVEPLASEFGIVFQQQKFGIPFRDALLDLGSRVPSKDLHFLITAILVQKETGGDLTEILDRTTHVIRERVRIEGEIRTYTAQGRLTGWILASLPIVLLLLINVVTPGYSSILFHDPTGQKLLYAGATLIVIGGLIIRKIVDIKV
jgi:tight adherence protein B